MARQLSPDSVRLLELARAQEASIRNAQVRECWYIIIDAIARQWLGATGRLSIDRLADQLEAGGGITVDEFSADVDHEEDDPGRVIVHLVDERYVCPRAELVDELRRLGASYRGHGQQTLAADLPPTDQGGDKPFGGAEPPQGIAAELERILAMLTTHPDPAKAKEVRAEADRTLSRWLDTPYGELQPDLQRAVDELSATDRSRFAEVLRIFTDWMDQPDKGGEQVDRLIANLENTFGPLLTAGRQADRRATEKRMRSEAADSIARRLREAGAPDHTES
jgi:hypothetical protein